MSGPAELKVATWNAMFSFGDERVRGAIQAVELLGRPGVLGIQEFTRRGEENNAYATEARERLYDLGYTASRVVDYSSEPTARNWYTMGLWSRIPGTADSDISAEMVGNRYGLHLAVPDFGVVRAIHKDDASEAVRQTAAETIVAQVRGTEHTIIMGGFNAMHHSDPRSRLPRAIDRVVRHIPIKDYYSGGRLHWRLSEVQRVAGMARGGTMNMYAAAGFTDADPYRRPTVGCGPIAYQLDHILASAGLEVAEFSNVDMRGLTENGQPLSNHLPLAATVRY